MGQEHAWRASKRLGIDVPTLITKEKERNDRLTSSMFLAFLHREKTEHRAWEILFSGGVHLEACISLASAHVIGVLSGLCTVSLDWKGRE